MASTKELFPVPFSPNSRTDFFSKFRVATDGGIPRNPAMSRRLICTISGHLLAIGFQELFRSAQDSLSSQLFQM
jgi:hypothetical protein